MRARIENRSHPGWMTTMAVAFVAAVLLPINDAAAESATLGRVRGAGKITLGYRSDARPFAYKDESGNAAGYAIDVCKSVAERVKAELGVATLAVEWVPVTIDDRVRVVQESKVDLLCGADGVTLSSRKDLAFSIPIYPGGIGALLRSDASFRLREVLAKGRQAGPFWRASPAQILEKRRFSAVKGTPGERWLGSELDKLEIDAAVVSVASYDAGVQQVLDRGADAFFADRAILLEAVRRSPSARDLMVLDRRFTVTPYALALQRGDDDFRLVVDSALSRLLGSDAFPALYAKWFGPFDEYTRAFFQIVALPE